MLKIFICGLEVIWVITLLASVALIVLDVLSAVDPDRDQDKVARRMLVAFSMLVVSIASKVVS